MIPTIIHYVHFAIHSGIAFVSYARFTVSQCCIGHYVSEKLCMLSYQISDSGWAGSWAVVDGVKISGVSKKVRYRKLQ